MLAHFPGGDANGGAGSNPGDTPEGGTGDGICNPGEGVVAEVRLGLNSPERHHYRVKPSGERVLPPSIQDGALRAIVPGPMRPVHGHTANDGANSQCPHPSILWVSRSVVSVDGLATRGAARSGQ